MRGKKGRQGGGSAGAKGGSLMKGRGASSRRVARGVHGANLLEDLGTVGWVGRHEGGANGVAMAVASASAGTTWVRSDVFLGGSTTHDDADDATKKSVALPEGAEWGAVVWGALASCGITRPCPQRASRAAAAHLSLRRNSLRRYAARRGV